jgi:hypothetical protein
MKCQERRWKSEVFLLQLREMTKDAPLAFRIPAELKRGLLKIAKREGRSLSQVCEMLLTIGTLEYEKSGSNYLQKTLTQNREDDER